MPAFSVKLSDDAVFALRAALGGKSPELRAREASEQLKRAFDTETTSDVGVVRRGDVALLMVGKTPIVELSEEEAKLAEPRRSTSISRAPRRPSARSWSRIASARHSPRARFPSRWLSFSG